VKIQETETKAMTITEQAKSVAVVDIKSYKAAGEIWKNLKSMEEEINSVFQPIISAANKAHKEAIAQKAKVYNPVHSARTDLKAEMSA